MKTTFDDLGLAIAHVHRARRGVAVPHGVIAAYCGCTKANIWLIEQRAMHKLKRAAHLRHDPVLREIFLGSLSLGRGLG